MQRHYSDEELLEFLDGEVGWVARWRFQMHLFRCWECRGQKAELEAQAHRVAQALRSDRFPGPERVAVARERFERYLRTFAEPARAAGLFRTRFAWAGALALVLLAGAAAVRWKSAPAPALSASPSLKTIGQPQRAAAPVVEKAPEQPVVASSRPSRNPPPDLKLIEADVHYRLHRIGACAGEPVLIHARDRWTVAVMAVAPPASRRREIEEALSDLQRAGLVVFSATGDGAGEVPVEALGDASQTYASSRLMESPLARRFASPEEFARRAAAVVQSAEAIYAEAWALQRHASLAEPGGAKKLPARWLAEAMERDHTARIRTHLDRLRSEMQPLGAGAAGDCVAEGSPLDAAAELAALVHRVFAPTSPAVLATAQQDAERLPVVVTALECALR